MVLRYDEDGLVRHDLLNLDEARIFVAFLRVERAKHSIDVNNINKTIRYLKDKWRDKLDV